MKTFSLSRTKNLLQKRIGLHREEIIRFLSDLVSIPTTNPPGEFYEVCAKYISRRLSGWKIEHRLIRISGGRYPRLAVVSRNAGKTRAIHFHGHYDVIPVQTLEQFRPVLLRDRLYGRGSSDMKGGLAAMILALRLLQEEGLAVGRDVTFSIVPDEETGGRLGTQRLFEKKILPQGRWGMIMPEPTDGDIWFANKGALTFRITVAGKSAHVGLARQGINAFERMITMAESFLKFKGRIERRGDSVMLIGGTSGSGSSFNLVPNVAYFTVDCRLGLGQSLKVFKGNILKIIRDKRKKEWPVEIKILQEGNSSWTDPDMVLGRALARAVRQVKGRPARYEICPGLLEIRFFNVRGIPAYACGPGVLAVSHGPHEYVNIRDILDATAIYVLAVRDCFSGDKENIL